jgi:DNA repair exonuclease SbcCD nuclease subunit
MRLLHTSDWQLGLKAGHLGGDAAATARRARLEAVGALAELARERAVDLVVVAGDVFDDNAVADGVVHAAAQLLDRFAPIPVLLLPGNHDAFTPGAVLARLGQLSGGHVTVLDRPDPLQVCGGRAIVYPCPLRERHVFSDPTAWIPERTAGQAGALRLGVAHGAVDILPDDAPPAGPSEPTGGDQASGPDRGGAANRIAPDRAERAGLDYLALGDWHGTLRIGPRTWYSGTPAQTRMKERAAGGALIVELPGPGLSPQVERVPVSTLSWRRLRQVLSDPGDVEGLARQLAELERPERTLVELRLEGALPLSAHAGLQQLLARWRALLLHLRVRGEVRPVADEADLDAIATSGFVRQAAERLLARAGTAGAAPPSGVGAAPPGDAGAAVARRALGLLAALSAPPAPATAAEG